MKCNVQADWVYSDIVQDHFLHPRNLLIDPTEYKADGVGMVGSPQCGDMMTVWIKVEKGIIKECKWRTFGCASAIASTSMMSLMAVGMTLEEAKELKPQQIIKQLGGLPHRKFHCSVLGQEALREAVLNYENTTHQ